MIHCSKDSLEFTLDDIGEKITLDGQVSSSGHLLWLTNGEKKKKERKENKKRKQNKNKKQNKQEKQNKTKQLEFCGSRLSRSLYSQNIQRGNVKKYPGDMPSFRYNRYVNEVLNLCIR